MTEAVGQIGGLDSYAAASPRCDAEHQPLIKQSLVDHAQLINAQC